jgi:hypothetical protein
MLKTKIHGLNKIKIVLNVNLLTTVLLFRLFFFFFCEAARCSFCSALCLYADLAM